MDKPQTEIYVRYRTTKGQHGVFETPFSDARDAASQFAADADCISAFETRFTEYGRLLSSRDVTRDVRSALVQLIKDGAFEECPHGMVADEFEAWQSQREEELDEAREHEAIEREMLQI